MLAAPFRLWDGKPSTYPRRILPRAKEKRHSSYQKERKKEGRKRRTGEQERRKTAEQIEQVEQLERN